MNNFIKDSVRTESSFFKELEDGEGLDYSKERLIHAQMGMQTECAEFTDALKKSLFYGKKLDAVNLKEELGDLMWYMAIAMDELGTDFQTEADRVIKKLKHRYPKEFTKDKAENRDLKGERDLLEQKQDDVHISSMLDDDLNLPRATCKMCNTLVATDTRICLNPLCRHQN